jgi:hypothetical protein
LQYGDAWVRFYSTASISFCPFCAIKLMLYAATR